MKPWAVMLVAGLVCGAVGSAQSAEVGLIRIDGAISPVTANYVAHAISVANTQHDACLIIQLDTPGGLLDPTKQIVEALFDSPVPTVVYVAPSGASAASAGCFITMAANVAAMAPDTTIGAAHPVEMGLGGVQKTTKVMKEKLQNWGRSFVEAIAEKRGRNVQWAASAVVSSAAITSTEALKLNVINLVARDMPDLLQQLDGRTINGKVLQTAGAQVVNIPMSPSEEISRVLARPTVMFLLMLVAIYGIFAELSHPGGIVPGVVGGIALILTLYSASVLPVNWAGLALVGLALTLFILDIFAHTHGVLTVGGIAAFFLGSLMLFNHAGPGFRLSLAYIIPATLLTAAFFLFIAGAGIRAQWLPVRSGVEMMIGKTAPALSRIDASRGKVFAEGEYWNAVSDTAIEPGQLVEIIGRRGLTLHVRPSQAGAM